MASHTFLLVLATASLAAAQDLLVKAPPQETPIAIEHATIHTIARGDIQDGTIWFDKGVIRGVGQGGAVAVPPDARRIDARGKHVYPGLISPVTQVGLSEIGAVRATIDTSETGDVTPEVRAAVAVNPDSTVIPVTRSNGVLTVGVFPQGGAIAGRAAVISLEGWTWEEMAVETDAGLVVTWPAPSQGMRRGRGQPQEEEEKKRLAAARALIDRTFEDARAWLSAKAADPDLPTDERFAAMRAAIESKKPVFLIASSLEQIEDAVSWAVSWQLQPVLVGGDEADLCLDLLQRHHVPVIVSGTHRVPRRRDSDYDEPFHLPVVLDAAGIRWCIAAEGSFFNERNLPYSVATAVAFGLAKERALRAITLSAAEILGVADQLGSLEEGKLATLMITDGDPLATPTHVERAFIRGRDVDLRNKQTELARKYREKYRQMGILPAEAAAARRSDPGR